jgi:hypothetical protein
MNRRSAMRWGAYWIALSATAWRLGTSKVFARFMDWLFTLDGNEIYLALICIAAMLMLFSSVRRKETHE